MLHTGSRRDDKDVLGYACNDGEEAATEIVAGAEGRNNDRDVIGRVGWCRGQSYGLECPRGDDVDDQASVSPEPAKRGLSARYSHPLEGREYLPEADECQKVIHVVVVVAAFYTRVLITGPWAK